MGACTAIFHALEAGSHIAVSAVVYYGVLSWLAHFAEQRSLSYTVFEAGNLEHLAVILRTKKRLWFGWKHRLIQLGWLLILRHAAN